MSKCECFTIDISQCDNLSNICVRDFKTILRFPKRSWCSLFYPAIMQADPFLFVHNDTLHLFYEEMLLGKGLGVIKTISTKDLIHWTEPVQITNEPECHFSYPFVFSHNGSIYMMPETGADHTIRLYKAQNDELTKFKYEKNILQRKDTNNIKYDFADSCIYFKDDVYYLFTSYCDDENTYYLELYTSNRFDGGYVLHPKSPICVSAKYGRCGGSIIKSGSKLYRPAQDCETVYGGQLHLMEIDALTPTHYAEHLYKSNIIPQSESFYKDGGHHINITNFCGKTIIARDARFLTNFLMERVRQYIFCKI